MATYTHLKIVAYFNETDSDKSVLCSIFFFKSWRFQAYPPGSSIFARRPIYPSIRMELIRRWQCFELFIIYARVHAWAVIGARTRGPLLVRARTTMDLKTTTSKAYCYYLANIVINSFIYKI